MSDIVTTMDQLPLEVLEMIFDKLLWENPGELYRLRTVSRTWRIVAERSGSRVFKYWYNRCQEEIPEDHLTDIVEAKFPLVAHPWKEHYWVNSRLPNVAKNVYDIWKNFPNVDDESRICSDNLKAEDILEECSSYDFVSGMNDKYLALSSRNEDSNRGPTCIKIWIYRWDNLTQHVWQYDFEAHFLDRVDFYSTGKRTFAILNYRSMGDEESHISLHPIDGDNGDFPSNGILVELGENYSITQNECFVITNSYDSTYARRITLEHKIITERGLCETSTIIGQPIAGVGNPYRLEISGSTLYVIQVSGIITINKYQISRNSDGKLSFTLSAESIVTGNGDGEYGFCFPDSLCTYRYLLQIKYSFTMSTAFAWKKFQPYLDSVFDGNMKLLAVHANYVFCMRNVEEEFSICVFQKDHLIERMEAYNPDDSDDPDDHDNPHHLKYVSVHTNIGSRIPYSRVEWIRIIYVGSKATILIDYGPPSSYMDELALADFY